MPNEEREALSLTAEDRNVLYAARRYVGLALEKKLGLRIKIGVYFQDPLVAEQHPEYGFDNDFFVPWEPGLADGPTSARFAVVDYNADAETLTPPAKWNAKLNAFVDSEGLPLGRESKNALQFHQVHVWAVVQNALDYFEHGNGLGRKILWGFEGSRLIVVPHAGYGQNAYYDRRSKSLQFYFFNNGEGRRVDTCLSTDIINHEFGHAVLDGIRPYFIEAISPETAAFHEFVGDLTAILVAFRNNKFRRAIGAETQGDLSVDNALANIAAEFGMAVENRPYLRTANNKETMQSVAKYRQQPHTLSQVLTGAVFDIIFELSRQYMKRDHTIKEAFAYTVIRIQQMAIQALDLLPPVDATFRDYALAMLRAEEIANPTDPEGYRDMMLDIFIERGILDQAERESLQKRRFVFNRIDNIKVFHDVNSIASSRAEAYRFLDDNREALFIPRNVDVIVADLFTAEKLTRESRRLPRQIVMQYVWREDVLLDGPRFGTFSGQSTSMLCGGTLAFDENGNVMAWVRKPGSALAGRGAKAEAEVLDGKRRLDEFLEAMAERVKHGRIGEALESARGMIGGTIAPLTARTVDGALRFELAPHFGIHADKEDEMGGRQWQISS